MGETHLALLCWWVMPVETPRCRCPSQEASGARCPTPCEWALAFAAAPQGGLSREALHQWLNRLKALGCPVEAFRDERGQTPLHLAVDHGDVAAVRCLLALGANPDAVPSCWRRPSRRQPGGPVGSARPPDSRTSLQRALVASSAHPNRCCSLVPLLLEAGASPTGAPGSVPTPPLFFAIADCLACALRIMDAGGFVAMDRSDRKPVFHHLLDALIESCENSWPVRPAHMSLWEALATRLCDRGANPEARDGSGRTVAQRIADGYDLWWGKEVAQRWNAWHSAWRVRQSLEATLPVPPAPASGRRL